MNLIYEKMIDYAPAAYDLWSKQEPIEWGLRPAELVGKTSMVAVWQETDKYFYFGETTLTEPF